MLRAGSEIATSGQPAPIWRQGHGVDLALVSRPGLSADAAHDGARLPIPYPDHPVLAGRYEVSPVRREGERSDSYHMPAGVELEDWCVARRNRRWSLTQHRRHTD